MEDRLDATQLFRTLLNRSNPASENIAAVALRTAARSTMWRRNQQCDAIVGNGKIACVVAGAVRKFFIRANGQRQIIDLLIPGDFLGLAPSGPSFILEAVSNGTRVACFKKDQIDSLAESYPSIANLISNRAAEAIRRLENHLLIQSRTTAREKVGAYLASMYRRVAHNEDGAIVIPITRYDIADHLGLAVETVSRTITTLRRGGSISLPSPRQVEIHDRRMIADPTY
jgi:CRP-like cAMP-binding protein